MEDFWVSGTSNWLDDGATCQEGECGRGAGGILRIQLWTLELEVIYLRGEEERSSRQLGICAWRTEERRGLGGLLGVFGTEMTMEDR